ncbi:extensin family protein [Aurantiacibacter sp. MUD11]|uniref:extensin family protein n=1 Tax=Aurantiacibacter sp. MUD11 TaxID=3003265 RepID=UPI0022AB49B1|nr:extensin family protein [Aurantiacibacter sp. MUD11]WAT17796.1 extensin family protein [Aurantiacibacter sp. MUD11]
MLPLAALGLSACSLVPQVSGGGYAATETASHDRSTVSARSARIYAPAPVAQNNADNQCLAQLGEAGARFEPLPDRYLGQGCSNLGTVMMHALASDTGQLNVSNLGPVTCPVSSAFAAWARFGADRAAQQIFGQRLASIQTMGSYACRNVAGTSRRSAHASADAIDIGAFILADGTRISVAEGWNGNAKEREFLRVVQRSACRRFATVLGPDYNADHRDHFHFEGVIEGNSYCR